jgi:hypothetical protein
MKILLDECLPLDFRHWIAGGEVILNVVCAKLFV